MQQERLRVLIVVLWIVGGSGKVKGSEEKTVNRDLTVKRTSGATFGERRGKREQEVLVVGASHYSQKRADRGKRKHGENVKAQPRDVHPFRGIRTIAKKSSWWGGGERKE